MTNNIKNTIISNNYKQSKDKDKENVNNNNECSSTRQKGYFEIGIKISHGNCNKTNSINNSITNNHNNNEVNNNLNNINSITNITKNVPIRVSGGKGSFIDINKISSNTANNTKKDLM